MTSWVLAPRATLIAVAKALVTGMATMHTTSSKAVTTVRMVHSRLPFFFIA